MITREKVRSHFHWTLLWTAAALVVIGLINLHSATYNLGRGGISPFVWSQTLWLVIGSAVAAVLLFMDYRVLMRLAYPLYGISMILLVLVYFFGKTVAGNRSWLDIGGFSLQPSEFGKLALVILLARFLADRPPKRSTYGLSELLIPGAVIAGPLVLIILGKDMGSALFYLLCSSSILLFSGIQKKTLLILSLAFIILGGAAYSFFLSPHQKSRIEAFRNPDKDPRGRGYHLLQSKITVGSGRFLGKGYLRGMHSKLLYLPEQHTDFVYPVLAEEWGFLGCSGVLLLYTLLLVYGLQIASKASDRFGVFLGFGITMIFFWQVAINLGGVLGLMPLTGITLPLLSYGGSSVVTILIGISLLLNISMRRFMF